MRHLLAASAALVLAAGAAAEDRRDPLARAADAMAMHGVWYSRDVYLPLYGDAEVLEYFAAIPSNAVVLPVYSAAPLHFRRGEFVFVSTGFLVEARSERELLEATIPAAAPQDEARFQAMQARLRERVAEYAAATRRQLRRRP